MSGFTFAMPRLAYLCCALVLFVLQETTHANPTALRGISYDTNYDHEYHYDDDDDDDDDDIDHTPTYFPKQRDYQRNAVGDHTEEGEGHPNTHLEFGKRRLRITDDMEGEPRSRSYFNFDKPKRRLRFIKKNSYANFPSTPNRDGGEPDELDLYSRDSRGPRLRFNKRDLTQKQAQKPHDIVATTTMADSDNEEVHSVHSHSRKRRSLSEPDLDLPLASKRRVQWSFNNDLRTLTDMTIADYVRRKNKEREDLIARLLAAGKRSAPSRSSVNLSDEKFTKVLSRALSDVLLQQ